MFLAPNDRFNLDIIEGLEQKAITEAKNIGYYDVKTQVKGKFHIDKDDIDDFYKEIEFFMEILGYNVSDNNEKVELALKKDSTMLHLASKKANAVGNIVENGFIVYKGATICNNERVSCTAWIKKIRKGLVESGDIKNLVLTKDILFKSPSAAAACLIGGETNGLLAWKDADGKTLKEIMKANKERLSL